MDHELLLPTDLADPGLFIPLGTDTLSSSLILRMLPDIPEGAEEDAAIDLRFLNPAIFRIPLRKLELLLFSVSDIIDDGDGAGGDPLEVTEERVAGLCTLEEHEVGAVDWERIELCLFDSVSSVVAEKEEAMISISNC